MSDSAAVVTPSGASVDREYSSHSTISEDPSGGLGSKGSLGAPSEVRTQAHSVTVEYSSSSKSLGVWAGSSLNSFGLAIFFLLKHG